MLIFLLSVFLLLITPGPGVLSIAGVGAAYGAKAGMRYLIGLLIGTNLVALAVVSGLATVVFALPFVRIFMLVLSAVYLIFLALRIAFAGRNIGFIKAVSQPGIRAGLLLQTVNPKAYVVNMTLFTGFAFLPDALFAEILIKFVIINVIWIPIHILWLVAGGAVQRLELNPNTQFRINLLMAASMLAVVALAGFSVV